MRRTPPTERAPVRNCENFDVESTRLDELDVNSIRCDRRRIGIAIISISHFLIKIITQTPPPPKMNTLQIKGIKI